LLCKDPGCRIISTGSLKFIVMKKLFFTAVIALSVTASAQNNTAYNIIEGSKTLVELIRVFKTPRAAIITPGPNLLTDSCTIKGTSDFCVKNNTAKPLTVTLYRRNGNVYDVAVLTMSILPNNRECLYDIKSGIYKMKLETGEEGDKKTFREGEIRINSCENPVENIQLP
jgi:hypothetical protein